ncbi:O-antigen ligase family protein [Ramlibacter sp. WS9]|uniref:O-antigen ligase family protein n=1 Tax=Ramlibacter sp. WS9 TaxID=1882741 RepID=UPI001142D24C|nr:O-antigen ligase family protein [Ramlibacter sp. WS9]ROZ61580.1 O-antigen ligase family protein [Ramlibacter sp. WS9]
MAKKKRNRGDAAPVAAPADGPASVVAGRAAGSPGPMQAEAGGAALVAIFALMMLLAPAMGVPNELMLQDTLKSIVVAFAVLGAALLFLWQQRERREPLRWHGIVWLPLLLMAYAFGSMAWSHTYLGGVEAVRWFIFAVLLWLGINSLARDRLPMLAHGIHLGAVFASLWAVLQFWIDWRFFPQGPHPASTFVNRNFFAEFAVCTLPFSALLLAQARQSARIALLAATTGLVIVAILMTGTRSALIALWLQLLVVLPFIAWFCRTQLEFRNWKRSHRALAAGVLIGTVLGLGWIPTGDRSIVEEGRGVTALERGFKRTGSISPDDPSLGIRMVMWKATARVIQQRPLSGVGAGAWESDIPLYQEEGAQLETDYYVHNEFLQLLAEYGLVGWLFLLALAGYLLHAAWRTLRGAGAQAQAEAPWRAVFLCSLLALMIVSNVGFPWRMATTGALFALCLAGLAASDARLGAMARWTTVKLPWSPVLSRSLAVVALCCLLLAAYITRLAAESEHRIVSAAKIALTISASGDPNNTKWNASKAEMLRLIREGVDMNPHYRKITPIVADELARWGDWKNATWIWESVLSSRPNVVAIMANVARGYTSMGDMPRALQFMEKAKKIQPRAPAVRSLEVILLSRSGQEARALELARAAIAEKIVDYDLANAAFWLAARARDFDFAAQMIQLRSAGWPQTAVDGSIQLGNMYAIDAKDADKALVAFRQAMAAVPEAQRRSLLPRIPVGYWPKLGFTDAAPAASPASSPAQTSASKG